MNQSHAAQSASAQVDEAELAKFEAIAHRFWDPQGEFGTLHTLNPARMSFIAERVAMRGSQGSARVADVGCGGGLLAEALARAGAEVTAIDLAPSMIEVAKLHAAGEGLRIDYRVQSVEALAAEAAGSFDVVTCMEMLEHLPDPGPIIRALSRLLKPEGSLFVSTLNRNFRSFMMAIVGAEYVTGLVPRGTHEYERLIRPSELARWARDADLVIEEFGGLEYNPITRSARLTGDVSVNYLAHLRRADSAQ